MNRILYRLILSLTAITGFGLSTGYAATRSVSVSENACQLAIFVPLDVEYRIGEPAVSVIGPEEIIRKIEVREKGVSLEIVTEEVHELYLIHI